MPTKNTAKRPSRTLTHRYRCLRKPTWCLTLPGFKGNDPAKLRSRAQSLVQRALKLAPNDPIAQEVARKLADGDVTPLRKPTQAAADLMAQAETLFTLKQYDETRKKYELAAGAAPSRSVGWLYAGDCLFALEDYAQGEIRLRKATEIEPLIGQAWRFLADALIRLGSEKDSVDALLMGIAAHPSQLPNWDRLAKTGDRKATPFKRLALVMKSGFSIDPVSGSVDIEIASATMGSDSTLWLAMAIREAHQAQQRREGKMAFSPFPAELANWTNALEMNRELTAKGKPLEDPALLMMQMLAREGQLEPALLLLTYRESYRPDFEAWKKAHPDGIKQFIKSYVRP